MGSTFNCSWYGSDGTLCTVGGHKYRDVHTADEACCVCGGGAPAAPGTSAPASPATNSPGSPDVDRDGSGQVAVLVGVGVGAAASVLLVGGAACAYVYLCQRRPPPRSPRRSRQCAALDPQSGSRRLSFGYADVPAAPSNRPPYFALCLSNLPRYRCGIDERDRVNTIRYRSKNAQATPSSLAVGAQPEREPPPRACCVPHGYTQCLPCPPLAVAVCLVWSAHGPEDMAFTVSFHPPLTSSCFRYTVSYVPCVSLSCRFI